MLALYYSSKSCAYAPHILLHDAGATFEACHIDFAAGEQNGPEFLAINPKGRVPALVTPDGILTENPAILLYIAQTYPQAGLAPTEPGDDMCRDQVPTVPCEAAFDGRGVTRHYLPPAGLSSI